MLQAKSYSYSKRIHVEEHAGHVPTASHVVTAERTYSRLSVFDHAAWSMRRIIALSCLPGPGSM